MSIERRYSLLKHIHDVLEQLTLTKAQDFTLRLMSATPNIRFHETDASADNGIWGVEANSESFFIQAILDDLSNARQALRIDRTGMNIDFVRVVNGAFQIPDGITAPPTATGFASIYVDTADGDLKVKFGDGTVKTIVTDT